VMDIPDGGKSLTMYEIICLDTIPQRGKYHNVVLYRTEVG